MTAAQTAMYFSLWGRVRDTYKARGLPCGDVQRHALHLKALGIRKSSKDFSNADLDKVKAAMLAIVEPDNLTNQLRALDQPDQRRDEVWKKLYAICEQLRIGNKYAWDEHDLYQRRLVYINGLVAKVIKPKTLWTELTDKEANVLLGIMQRRLFAVARRRKKEATPDPDKVPF